MGAGQTQEDGKFSWLRTQDGVRLRAAFWPGRRLRGTVLLLQGRTEYIEKYHETIGELRARGFAASAFDWRGQGLSDRALPDRHKGHVRDFAEYHRDMDCFLDGFVARTAELPKPYLILAHSMGAHIALRYLHDRPGPFSRAVLCSPMASISTAPLPPIAARAIAWVGVKAGMGEAYVPGGRAYEGKRSPFRGNALTHDRTRFSREAERLRENPGLALGSPSLGWLDAAFRSIKMLMQPPYCAAISTPALVIYGSGETVSSPLHQARLAEMLGAGRAECIPGARHEILQETDDIRAQFWAAFDGFV